MSFGEVPPQRRRLASALRSLREASQLSTTQLAGLLGVSQSKVSRLELGRTTPTAADVSAWAEATGATPQAARDVLDQVQAVEVEAVAWRTALRRGLPGLQHDLRELEASAARIATYSPVLVPGLMQTAEYARRVVEMRYRDGRADVAAAIGARMQRQRILYEDGRRLEFVVGEAALRWRFGPPAAVREQLNRLIAVTELPTVTLGVLPSDGGYQVWHTHGFNLFDERGEHPPIVEVETLTVGLQLAQADDVEQYRGAFAGLLEHSLVGTDALDLLHSL